MVRAYFWGLLGKLMGRGSFRQRLLQALEEGAQVVQQGRLYAMALKMHWMWGDTLRNVIIYWGKPLSTWSSSWSSNQNVGRWTITRG
jgi:hypothetical protein